MLTTLTTLARGITARSEEALRAAAALELIDQKIREAEDAQRAAKMTLASLIGRERAERRAVEALTSRITDLESRARAALGDGAMDLATEAAQAIAELENEREARTQTLMTLGTKVRRLQGSVEKTHRRLIDLRHGATRARAVEAERRTQMRLNRNLRHATPAREAQELITEVLGRSDPLEEGEILDQIDDKLTGNDLAERMGAAGYGTAKTSAQDILNRLQS
ncbi:MAG: PspA/IM30 family protein [Pseudomonadota bacterium]